MAEGHVPFHAYASAEQAARRLVGDATGHVHSCTRSWCTHWALCRASLLAGNYLSPFYSRSCHPPGGQHPTRLRRVALGRFPSSVFARDVI